MKRLLYTVTALLLMVSCLNKIAEKAPEADKNIDFDKSFEAWLFKQGLSRAMIIDTTKKDFFELWAYRDRLVKDDSMLYWYPSTDSSYYLITNFNRETKSRLTSNYSRDIELRFLRVGERDVCIGLDLIDSLDKRSVDFTWYDSTSFFFIEDNERFGGLVLIKLRMGIDSLWRYKIEK